MKCCVCGGVTRPVCASVWSHRHVLCGGVNRRVYTHMHVAECTRGSVLCVQVRAGTPRPGAGPEEAAAGSSVTRAGES